MSQSPFDTLEGAVKQIWVWQHANTGSFCSQLINLYLKADGGNRARLDRVFPDLGRALALWQVSSDNGEELFKVYGITGEKDL